MASNKMDEIKTIHDEDVDVKNRRVYIFYEINNKVAKYAVQNLHFLDNTEGDIHVYFNTPGGNWDDGMAIYNAILHCKNTVIGYVMGTCSSMGSLILQACDLRKIYEHCNMLVHPGEANHKSPVLDFIERAEYEKLTLKIMNQIYYDRMLKTAINRMDGKGLPSLKKFVTFISRDRYVMPDQALKLGLVDEIEKITEEG